LGFGAWALGFCFTPPKPKTPKPQTPIPNPQKIIFKI